jgi:hypothetical protein
VIKLRVQNVEKIQRTLAGASEASARALRESLRRESGRILNEAQKLVPVVTGRLRSSAYMRGTERNQHRTDFDFGYSAPYAVRIHEERFSGRTTRNRPGAKNNGKGYKWLERAARRVMVGVRSRTAKFIRAAMARGVQK